MAYIGGTSPSGGRFGGEVEAAMPFNTKPPSYSNQMANLGLPDPGVQAASIARPYASVGKMQLNLLDPHPELAAGQSPNETGGFVTGLLGAIGGTFGDPGREVGQGLGHVLEGPLGLGGNILGAFGSIPIPGGSEAAGALGGALEATGLTRHGQQAPTILSDLTSPFEGPVSLGGLFQTALGGTGLLGRAVERTYAGSGARGALPPDLQEAVDNGTMAHDEAVDQAVIRGQGFTDNPYTNIMWSILSDPLTWLSLGVGGVSSAVAGGEKVANAARVLGAIDRTAEVSTGAARALRAGAAGGAITDARMAAAGIKGLSRIERLSMNTVGALPGFDATLVPVANQVIRMTDPLKVFSGGDIGRRTMEAVSTSATTGVMAALKFQTVDRIGKVLDGAVSGGRDRMNQALGIYTTQLQNQYILDDLSTEYLRRGAVPVADGAAGVAANPLILARGVRDMGALDASVGRDLETMAEKVKPFGDEFGGNQAAMDADSVNRAAYISEVSPDRIKGLGGGYDEWAALHALTYAEAGRRLVDEVRPALKQMADAGEVLGEGLGNPEQYTMAARTTLTDKRWAQIEALIEAEDGDGVRKAIQQYADFNNINLDGIDVSRNAELFDYLNRWAETNKADLLKEIDLHDANGLWREDLPDPLLTWAQGADQFGYTLTSMPPPENMWRITRDAEGRVLHMQPFLEFSTEAQSVANPGWLDTVRQQAFRQIRTERILWTNRRKFVQLASADSRISAHAADSIYKAIMYAAGERGITPRGLRPTEILQAAKNALRTESQRGALGLGTMSETELTKMLLTAFDGDVGLVGVTQKVTGQAKIRLPGAGENQWGQISERLYPMARFGLNHFFMIQEFFEPYILNLMRGQPLPLSRDADRFLEASAWRKAADNLVRNDLTPEGVMMETAEMQKIVQAGIQQAHDHIGPTTKLGRFLSLRWGGIAERKEAAAGLLTRQMTGDLMKQAFTQIKGPEFWQELEIAFRSTDPAVIAERWITHSMAVADANGDKITAFVDILKPHNIGAETRVFTGEGPGVRWHHVAEIVGRTEEGADTALLAELKAGYRVTGDVPENALTRDGWLKMTDDAGIDRAFAERSYKMATGPDVQPFWKSYRKAYDSVKGMSGKERDANTAAARQLIRVRSRVMGLSEDEFIKTHFAAPVELATNSETEAIAGSHALLEMVDHAAVQIRTKTFSKGRNIDEVTQHLGTSLDGAKEFKEGYRHRGGALLWSSGGDDGVVRRVMPELSDVDAMENHFNSLAMTDPDQVRGILPQLSKADQGHAIKLLEKADEIRGRMRYRFVDPQGRSYYFGGVKPQDLVDMARDIMPEAEGLAAKDWYTQLRTSMVSVFGPTNADTVLKMFGVSQANDSPVNGLQMVLRAFEQAYVEGFDKGKIGQREFVTVVGRKLKDTEKRLGLQLNAENITRMLLDMPVDRGFAAKLNDFMDSMAGNTSRRWTGRTGLMPVAVDRHTARDIGFMDAKVIEHLSETAGTVVKRSADGQRDVVRLADADGQVIATVRKDDVPLKNGKAEERWHLVDDAGNFVDGEGNRVDDPVRAGDMPGQPEPLQYEHGVGVINEATRLFNEQKVWGRSDWEPSEVQAVGWMRVQKTVGGMEEDPMDTLRASTYVMPVSINPAQGSDLYERQRILSQLDNATRARVTEQVLTDVAQGMRQEWGAATIVSDQATHAGTMRPLIGPPKHEWDEHGFSRGRHVTIDEAAGLRVRGQRFLAGLSGRRSPITAFTDNYTAAVDDLHSAIVEPWGGATFDPRTGKRIRVDDGRFVSAVGDTVSLTPAEARDPARFTAAMNQFMSQNRGALDQDSHVIGVFNDQDLERVDIDLAVMTHELEDAEAVQLTLNRPGGAYDFITGNGVYAPLAKEAGIANPVTFLSTEETALDAADRLSVTTRSIVKTPRSQIATGQFDPAIHRPVIELQIPDLAEDTAASQDALLRLVNAMRQREVRNGTNRSVDWALVPNVNGVMTLQLIDDAPPELAFTPRYVKAVAVKPVAGHTIEVLPPSESGTALVSVRDSAGKEVGHLEFARAGKRLTADAVVVSPEARRQGIANWMYSQAEKETGGVFGPSASQTAEAEALWLQPGRPFGRDSKYKVGMLDEMAFDAELDQLAEEAGIPSLENHSRHAEIYVAEPPKNAAGEHDWSTEAHINDTVTRLRDRGRTDVTPDTVSRWRDKYARNLDTAIREADQTALRRSVGGDRVYDRRADKVLGYTRRTDDGRVIIGATKNADPITGLHELTHVFATDLDESQKKLIQRARLTSLAEERGAINERVAETQKQLLPRPKVVPAGVSADDQARFDSELEAYNRDLDAYRAQQDQLAGETAGPPPAVQTVVDKWRTSESKNGARMERDLLALETQGHDISAAEDALGDYNGIERGDFTDREEYMAERQDAWDRILEELDQVEHPAAEIPADQLLQPPTKPTLPPVQPESTVMRERAPGTQRKYRSQLAALQNDLGELVDEADWGVQHEEWFVDQFQKWLKTGRPPTRELQGVFDHFRNWLSEVWTHLRANKSVRDQASPEMTKLFESMFDDRVPTAAYDQDQHALMIAAKQSIRQATDMANTTQYFKRGRSFAERSINHPFLGMYPASYYWGKILPEMVRFLALRPFGMKTPFLAWNAAREVSDTIRVQQSIDPGLRQFLTDNDEFLQTISMLFPALPNDMPVNAPLWARRVSEQGLENADRVAAGQAAKPVDYMKGVADSAAWVFGPYSSLQQTGSLLKGLGDTGRSAVGTVIPGFGEAKAPGGDQTIINPLTGQPLQ